MSRSDLPRLGGDPELVALAREGDAEAATRLFAANRSAALALARKVGGDEELAHDVVNDLALDFARRVRTFKAESAFSTWFYQVVRNAALSALRRHRAPRTGDLETAPEPADASEGDRDGELFTRLAIARLRLPRDREVAALRGQGYRYAEIARRIGSTETAVRTRFHRIRARLRRILEETS